ncbi:response regulator transcription factor [Tepidimicrobium xylanilyticum]|uniref:DNA-binding response regulator, OmpR family, contains REC and winged-helix (WHTH) domain n=1 Tax=Tepidimicrobium xylanilyticum TaxID=1123352 RepID=A0A1H3ASU1_9FIRM|nr:response regulator transcription factor [Tepidimicrobium xylanilyticum]GMG97651.1 DNA-binding response regulator [Tepidimicrobium xylanilyticum]SDX32782.1 DNA-binding response regulator, OmpR family, contains REC and winged-helix (wHTH) domain [Tepidimicrobium xylanilyticum]
METILVIDDETDLTMIIKDALESNGYKVLTANNGFDGIELSRKDPDLIILDIMMPDIDGYNLCSLIRDSVDCPILFLSARDSEGDKIKGLAIGGDDYITKPFSLKELVSRVKAHLRREKRRINKVIPNALTFKKMDIDLKGFIVRVNNKNINLTKREFEIVELLALHPGQVFSKDQIYEKIWGYDGLGDTSTVTEHIKNIRSKISSQDKENKYIETVWGLGYRWEA